MYFVFFFKFILFFDVFYFNNFLNFYFIKKSVQNLCKICANQLLIKNVCTN